MSGINHPAINHATPPPSVAHLEWATEYVQGSLLCPWLRGGGRVGWAQGRCQPIFPDFTNFVTQKCGSCEIVFNNCLYQNHRITASAGFSAPEIRENITGKKHVVCKYSLDYFAWILNTLRILSSRLKYSILSQYSFNPIIQTVTMKNHFPWSSLELGGPTPMNREGRQYRFTETLRREKNLAVLRGSAAGRSITDVTPQIEHHKDGASGYTWSYTAQIILPQINDEQCHT